MILDYVSHSFKIQQVLEKDSCRITKSTKNFNIRKTFFYKSSKKKIGY